jgi:hypothetical protein
MHRLRLKHRRQSSDGYGPRRRGSFAGVVVEDYDVQKKMRDGWQQGCDRMMAAELYWTISLVQLTRVTGGCDHVRGEAGDKVSACLPAAPVAAPPLQRSASSSALSRISIILDLARRSSASGPSLSSGCVMTATLEKLRDDLDDVVMRW